MPPRVSVVLPVRDEAELLPRAIVAVRAVLDAIDPQGEIVLAEGGSSDATLSVCTAAAGSDPRHRVVSVGRPGRGEALRSGLGAARGDVVVCLDADLELPASVVPELVSAISHAADVAVAHRKSVESRGPARSFVSAAARVFATRLLGVPVSDPLSGARAFSRRALDLLLPRTSCRHWAFDLEILVLAARAGLRFADPEPATSLRARAEGRSKVSLAGDLLREGAALLGIVSRPLAEIAFRPLLGYRRRRS